MTPKVILVCGSRKRGTEQYVARTLDRLSQWFADDFAIVQGGAKFVDFWAKNWAYNNGHACITVNANWDFYDNQAGPIRNGWMLKFIKVDLVIAFDGDNGTKDMIRRAKKANIPVHVVDPE